MRAIRAAHPPSEARSVAAGGRADSASLTSSNNGAHCQEDKNGNVIHKMDELSTPRLSVRPTVRISGKVRGCMRLLCGAYSSN